MLTHLAILVATTQVSIGASTDASEEVAIHNEIMDNVSVEYAKCAVYYSHVSAAMGNAEKPDAASNYKALSEGALNRSLMYAKFSRTEEMSAKIVAARVDIITSQMLDEIDEYYSNIGILFSKYHDRCDFVINKTDELLEEWEETIRKEHGQD
jgi:hypothetical protein